MSLLYTRDSFFQAIFAEKDLNRAINGGFLAFIVVSTVSFVIGSLEMKRKAEQAELIKREKTRQ